MKIIRKVFALGNFDKLVIDAYPATWFRNGEPFSLQEWPQSSELYSAMKEVEEYIDKHFDIEGFVITIVREESKEDKTGGLYLS